MDSVYSLKKEIQNQENSKSSQELESVLFSRGKRADKFFTGQSGLYFDCGDKEWKEILKFRSQNKFFDGLNRKALRDYKKFRGSREDFLWMKYKTVVLKLNQYKENISESRFSFLENISIVRLWNTSILAAVIVGMISMSFIYRYLGQGAAARDEWNISEKAVAGVSVEQTEEEADNKLTKEEESEYVADLAEYLQIEADKDFNRKVKELVKGYPIENFLPYLLDKDHDVVAFYIAIAKKESNWGKRVPVLNGEDCYNYVGYRGGGKTGSGGHTCFATPQEAVDVVSRRLEELIKEYNRDTAKEMVVWKCGSSCAATGGQAAANKWIADVDMYLKKVKGKEK